MRPAFASDAVLCARDTERGRLLLLDWSKLPDKGLPCASRNVMLVDAGGCLL